MAKALVTGASGFIGSHLLEALLARGVAVRCLLRPTSDRRWLAGLDYEEVVGALDERPALARAVEGVDVVYHCAGAVKARNAAAYHRANARGTADLADACLARGTPPLFVYVSSQAAAGPCRDGASARETFACEPITDYGKSKLEGERALAARGDALPFVVLRPSAVYGPRDKEMFVFFKFIARGIEPALGWADRYVSLCYISDLVAAAMAAGEVVRARGQTYFIAHDEVWDWRGVSGVVAAAAGVKTRRVMVPKALLFGAATLAELAATFTGRAATLNWGKARDLAQERWVCDATKAKNELGFTPAVGLAAGAALTVAWYRDQGWL